MPKFTAEELKSKSLEDLAVLAERNDPLSSEGVLIKEEFERRRNEAQRTALPTKRWHETFIGKVIVSVVAGVILLFLALLITKHFISTPQQPITQKASTQRTAK